MKPPTNKIYKPKNQIHKPRKFSIKTPLEKKISQWKNPQQAQCVNGSTCNDWQSPRGFGEVEASVTT